MIFDTHAHYDSDAFDDDRFEILAAMPENNVGGIVNPGCDLLSSRAAVALAEKYDFVYAAVGWHPEDIVGKLTDEAYNEMCALTSHPKCVAIGEIGLDYYWDKEHKEEQKALFRRQIELALSLNKPVIVHDREAHGDSLEIIRDYPELRGVFHCYSGSAEMAKELLKRGWYLGFDGPVTYKNARQSREVIELCPLDRMLVETDSPYLTPVPHRGKRNDSSKLCFVIEKIAEIKGMTPKEIEEITYENALHFYGLEDKKELRLEGAPNARELGGIKTSDGRKVKFNRLIRSGQLCYISDEDVKKLQSAGLCKVVDLRTTKERGQKPDREIEGVEYIFCPIMPDKVEGITREAPETEDEEAQRTVSMAMRLMTQGMNGREQMKSLYPRFAEMPHCVEHYAKLFEILLNTEEGAVLFHCTMGKDRAGMAAALVLYALGVPMETIVKDYLVTGERCAPGTKKLISACRKYTEDEAVLEYIYLLDTVEEDFIMAGFDTAAELYGSVDAFLRDGLGLDEDKLNRLRKLYLD